MSEKEFSSEEGKTKTEKEKSVDKHEENLETDSAGELADALDVEDPEERKKLIARISKFTSSPVPPPGVLSIKGL